MGLAPIPSVGLIAYVEARYVRTATSRLWVLLHSEYGAVSERADKPYLPYTRMSSRSVNREEH